LPIYVNLRNRQFETSRTETIGDEKTGFYNVPSFDSKTGLDYSNNQQKYDAAYKRTGGKVKKYKTVKEAVAAAKAESDAKGRKMKAMAEAARRKKK
jgi:hypothetical protein